MAEGTGLLGRAGAQALTWGAGGLAHFPGLVDALAGVTASRAKAAPRAPRDLPAVQRDKKALALALVEVGRRVLGEQRLTKDALQGMLRGLVCDVMVGKGDWGPKRAFAARHGCNPPDFLVISPGRTCNLRCVGCYSASGPVKEKLDWATLDRLVTDVHQQWGVKFLVLSGGEPFAYRDGGLGVMDLAERHPEVFFLAYSNGTLIDDAVARRLGALGNLSPGISIEGMRERTDARRGEGTFDKVLRAMERLRGEKVLFGLSLTATRENADELLSDEVVGTFFERMGALYAWMFHYMPMGRGPSLDLMLRPEQRLRLHRRVWDLVRERKLFITDFWNSATVTNGCLAGGRTGGYFHIDWNGAVSPCVFVPYSTVNLHDVYARGGTLDDVWKDPFFASFRDWQRAYGYRKPAEPHGHGGNWMRPCPIRDHHADFEEMLKRYNPKPTDEGAREAMEDPAYHAGLRQFGDELAALLDPIWEAEYAEKEPATAPGEPVPQPG